MKKLVIVGASGHGKVAADIAIKVGYTDVVFVDDDVSKTDCAGFPIIGRIQDARNLEGDKFVAIGNSAIRQKFMEEFTTVKLIHPNAVISRRVTIEEGTIIMAGAVINSDTYIGRGCIINTCASIDHDCSLGNYSHVAVGAHLCGTVKIGDSTWIGAGATISNNVCVTENCVIGAGAVVVNNIENKGTYVGVPAREIVK